MKSRAITQWIPLMEYSAKTGLSLSTLRRYIKSGKIPHRVEKGRYLLLHEEQEQAAQSGPTGAVAAQVLTDLQKAKEEIAELKTLIALYEEQFPNARI